MNLTTDLELSEDIEASRTYKILPDKIQGSLDGTEAVRQAVYKVLNTEKYEYPIYSFNYGIELDDLIGQDPSYVQIELQRRFKECLLADDRIKEVNNFDFKVSGDKMKCSFDVISVFGSIPIAREVNI
ncbi:MAG: Phage-like element protein XkdS [Lachnospiraceae bacterium]|jgi:hypothetical protein|nr:Phage-like element protein XkdS [Lachnospiraceae bacterium]